jgi:hypothetical protein
MPAKEAALTTTQQQIQKTEDLLTNLESDIGARVSEVGTAVSEPLRRRLLATEQAPITKQLQQLGSVAGIQETGLTSAREQLSNLLQLAQTGQERQATLAKAPLEFAQQLFPTMASLAEYQTPKEQLVNEIIKQMALQQISPTEAKAPTTIGTAETGLLQWNPDTESWEYITQPAVGGGKLGELLSPTEVEALGPPAYYGMTKGEAATLKLTPMPPTQLKAKTDMFDNIAKAKTAYGMLQASISTLGTVTNGPQARLRGAYLTKMSAVGLAHEAENFLSQRNAVIQLLASIFGAGGARGLKYSIPSIEGMVPDITDSTPEVNKKLASLNKLISDVENNVYSIYGGTPVSSGGTTYTSSTLGNTYNLPY